MASRRAVHRCDARRESCRALFGRSAALSSELSTMTPYPLHATERNTRILITMFLVSMIAAFGVAGLNVYDKVGRMKEGVVGRYGPENAGSNPQPSSTDEELPMEDA